MADSERCPECGTDYKHYSHCSHFGKEPHMDGVPGPTEDEVLAEMATDDLRVAALRDIWELTASDADPLRVLEQIQRISGETLGEGGSGRHA